jgi:DNA replication protein DnaC
MEHIRKLIQSRPVQKVTVIESEPRAIIPFPTVGSSKQPCSICKGAGYTRRDVQPGHPEFGKPLPCACKIAERKEKQQRNLVEVSGIISLERFRNASFETFNAKLPDVRVAYRQTRQFAAYPMGWLVLTGPYGCGKTHLAVAIANERIEAGDTVLVQTVPDLLDHLRAAYAPTAEQTFDETFQQMREVDLLVLDDYGAEQSTPWATEKLFQIFNYRYNKSLPMVVTSNNIDLEGIDQRIYSRLRDRNMASLIQMRHAHDYRIHGDQEDEE